MAAQLRIGDGLSKASDKPVQGEYLTMSNGEPGYKIANYDKMPPFFMSIVSDSNLWMYLSTTGGLTCGRISAENSLFPYYTVDKIHDTWTVTGPRTVVHVMKTEGVWNVWEPFVTTSHAYRITRNIYKNSVGNMVEFEEINEDLSMKFTYSWNSCDEFGFVRKCNLTNLNAGKVTVRVLDGIQNVLPSGVTQALQEGYSSLVDAYKWNELDAKHGLGLYSLYALLTDKAEPKESLKASTVFQCGLPKATILLSSQQLEAFRAGKPVKQETLVRGLRGAFFANSEFELAANATQNWLVVAEVNQTHGSVAVLQGLLSASEASLRSRIDAAVQHGTQRLRQIIGTADGLQCTEDAATTTHHYANVMFNVMRGGIFDRHYDVHRDDLGAFIKKWNADVAAQHKAWIAALPEIIHYSELLTKAAETKDSNLYRLCLEYLPLTFSRRHGDPSRPWNKFAIHLKSDDGQRILSYQGNWRDIFQNWEALVVSYPCYITGMIAKFVNAISLDGYNPYHVSRDGIQWEKPNPKEPWANIGYWGDHQVIYLQKLLEWSERFQPGELATLLVKEAFAYADVPYEIKPYSALVANPKDTIVYNWDRSNQVDERVKKVGSDGKLAHTEGKVRLVTLTEKLLVILLAKLSNFVMDGGIWLNTQRPEWNDANNALVGFGISMVTLYYIHRYIDFLSESFKSVKTADVAISAEVKTWFSNTAQVLESSIGLVSAAKVTPQQRRTLLDKLGHAGQEYRAAVYKTGLGGKASLTIDQIRAFLATAQKFVEQTIKSNQRADGLFHAYNLLSLGKDTAEVSYLYEMAEGQVSALSSGMIKGDSACQLLTKFFNSKIYRADQKSFMLYPDRPLKGFFEKNTIPESAAAKPSMAFVLSQSVRSIAYKDASNVYRFAAALSNADDLAAEIDKQAQTHSGLAAHKEELLAIFEEVFNHHAFTGRSGTMFMYEGLGCIYWHMVAKLLLATQEVALEAHAETPKLFDELQKRYYEVRTGLGGFNKTPAVYGAFPADPYSHTPGHLGAQQPGMTGQVKEEILTRWGELGVSIENGTLSFAPLLLRRSEFLAKPTTFEFVNASGAMESIALNGGQLGFTYCQVPIVYTAGKGNTEIVVKLGGQDIKMSGNRLPADLSRAVFHRLGTVSRIDVHVSEEALLK